jgi:hypothetical protein
MTKEKLTIYSIHELVLIAMHEGMYLGELRLMGNPDYDFIRDKTVAKLLEQARDAESLVRQGDVQIQKTDGRSQILRGLK